MRLVVISLIFIFAFYKRYVLIKEYKSSKKIKSYKENLKQKQQKLDRLLFTDSLTKLFNRKKFNELLKLELNKIEKLPNNLSIIICDIDHFNKINEMHGYDICDEVLISFSELLKSSLNTTDIIARLNGDEFIILLKNKTPEEAFNFIETLRYKIKSHKFDKIINLTASFGITFFKETDNENKLLKKANRALQLAKEKGRDCSIVII